MPLYIGCQNRSSKSTINIDTKHSHSSYKHRHLTLLPFIVKKNRANFIYFYSTMKKLIRFVAILSIIVAVTDGQLRTPSTIDLRDQSIETIEGRIKQHYDRFEKIIMWTLRNMSLSAPKDEVTYRLGQIFNEMFIERPVFFLPTSQGISAERCGAEIRQQSCNLISAFNARSLFLMPFDLDELASNESTVTPWHRNSPLVTMVRLCTGFKAYVEIPI